MTSRVVPNGFQTSFHPIHEIIQQPHLDSQFHHLSLNYSLSLMRLTLKAISEKLVRFRLRKNIIKNQLFSFCHKILADSIIAYIRSLNNDLFQYLSTVKHEKMQRITPVCPENQSDSIKDSPSEVDLDEIVRCIPESVVLSTSEKSLLSKGLNFVPTTPSADSFQNETDIQSFFRRLLLKAFFHGKDEESPNPSDDTSSLFSKFKKSKSNFTPKAAFFPVLRDYFRTCQSQIDGLNTKPLKRHNLTPD